MNERPFIMNDHSLHRNPADGVATEGRLAGRTTAGGIIGGGLSDQYVVPVDSMKPAPAAVRTTATVVANDHDGPAEVATKARA
jgi:hypothetical protein